MKNIFLKIYNLKKSFYKGFKPLVLELPINKLRLIDNVCVGVKHAKSGAKYFFKTTKDFSYVILPSF